MPTEPADPAPGAELVSALPPTGARILAFAAIVVAGICGGLIGWAVVDMQVSGNNGFWAGLGGLGGAVLAAGGVAVVAILVLRAMGEWRTIEHRAAVEGSPPPRTPARRT